MDINELESFKLSDAVKFHDNLNPALWTEKGELDPEVKDKLMDIARDFIAELGISTLKVEDITISGSNAAYTYTPHSDLDLHIIVDFKKLNNDEVYQELFNAKKTLYNDTHNIKVHGVPVELYVQDSNQPVVSLGEYSLLKNEWLKIPKKRKANFDQNATRLKYEKLGSLIELALKQKDVKKIDQVLKTIKRYRKAGLDSTGEFGPENLAFKALRKQGYIQKLYDLKNHLHSRELSIEDYHPNAKPRGPEFPPTMPAGTVRVDVSDVYDWYKLGQHISDLEGLGKHDFGKGPPSTILSFGDEDTEHKYIDNLLKTGLTTTDIDPKGHEPMKGQKTDPRYNVKEETGKKSAIYSTDVYGMTAYHSKCLEPGCDWESKRYDSIKLAQNAAQKHAQKHFKQGVAEGGAETSWSDGNEKITLQDILELTKHIKQINLPINDNLKNKLIHWDGNPEEIERINQVTVSNQFPILVMVDEQGQIDWILDGNHRLHKAIQSQAKTIPAKLIKPSDLDDKAKRVFHIKEQGVAEAFDQPYKLKWEKSEHGDYDALATLDDGTYLTIMFNNEYKKNWMVEFYRNNSQEVTGEGDAQRIFATVLAAIKQFITKKKPESLFFSAVKEDDPTGSRTKLYDRLVQRYASNLGYNIQKQEHPGQMAFKLTRINNIKEASGYIPSEKEKNDPRFKTALTKDVRPDSIKKNAKAFGFNVTRAGIPPLLRK